MEALYFDQQILLSGDSDSATTATAATTTPADATHNQKDHRHIPENDKASIGVGIDGVLGMNAENRVEVGSI